MLVQGNTPLATINATIIPETLFPSCHTIPNPCLFFRKAARFLESAAYPYLQAVLERIEMAEDNLRLQNVFLITNNTSALDDEIVYRALVKVNGYTQRFFSSESWDEWTEYKTHLGRVVSNFLEYSVQQEAEQAKLLTRSVPLLEKANEQAQALLTNLQRPLLEKIELVRSLNCYYKAEEAQLNGCNTKEALFRDALPRAKDPNTIRLKIKKDCCKVKLSPIENSAKKAIKLGTTCTEDKTHLLTILPFYRYGGNPGCKTN